MMLLRIGLLSAGIAVSLPAQGTSAPTTISAVEDAVLAKVRRPSGCLGQIQHLESRSMPFFPSVTMVLAECTAEHGDTIRTIVGADSAGLIYLLDSPSSFAFLLRRHRPVLSAKSNYFDYLRDALIYRGELAEGTTVMASITNLSELPRAVKRKWRNYRPTVNVDARGKRTLDVLLHGVDGLTHATAWITADGTLVVESERVWARPVQLTIN